MHRLLNYAVAGVMILLTGWCYERIKNFFIGPLRCFVERIVGAENSGWYMKSVGRYGAKVVLAMCFVGLVVCGSKVDDYLKGKRKAETVYQLGEMNTPSPPAESGISEVDLAQLRAQAQAIGKQLARNQIMATRFLCAPPWLQTELAQLDTLTPEERAKRLEDAAAALEVAREEHKWNKQYYEEQRELFLDKFYPSLTREERHLAEKFKIVPVYPRESLVSPRGGDPTLYRNSSGDFYKIEKGTVRKYDKNGNPGRVLN